MCATNEANKVHLTGMELEENLKLVKFVIEQDLYGLFSRPDERPFICYRNYAIH